MIDTHALAEQQTIETDDLRLEPLGPEHFDGTWAMLSDEEGRRLTGTHKRFEAETVRAHLEKLVGRDDRADWAVIRTVDQRYLGEVVLTGLDADNAVMGFRIALFGSDVLGRGYGTQATRAVLGYGFEVVGLHRIHLEVFDFNPRARRAYEKAGFVVEGVQREALLWEGERHDVISMAILRHEYVKP